MNSVQTHCARSISLAIIHQNKLAWSGVEWNRIEQKPVKSLILINYFIPFLYGKRNKIKFCSRRSTATGRDGDRASNGGKKMHLFLLSFIFSHFVDFNHIILFIMGSSCISWVQQEKNNTNTNTYISQRFHLLEREKTEF